MAVDYTKSERTSCSSCGERILQDALRFKVGSVEIFLGIFRFFGMYHLVMTNSLPWKMAHLPIKNGDFPWQTVSHNQMVNDIINGAIMRWVQNGG
jgi:hypothetical protein